MAKTLLCKDCKHYRSKTSFFYYDGYPKCAHPDLIKIDPVDGHNSAFCEHLRDFGVCGPKGKFWEAKNHWIEL